MSDKLSRSSREKAEESGDGNELRDRYVSIEADSGGRAWKSRGGEIYVGSGYFEPEDGSTSSRWIGTEEEFGEDVAFMGRHMEELNRRGILEETLGGDHVTISSHVGEVLDALFFSPTDVVSDGRSESKADSVDTRGAMRATRSRLVTVALRAIYRRRDSGSE